MTGSYEKDGKKVYTQDIMIQEITFLKQAKNEQKEELNQDQFSKDIEEFSQEADLSELDEFSLPF